jgi:UPF0716 protein FxsA
MWLVLFLVFIVVPIIEIYVLIQVGGLIGVWPTVALLIADSILGTMLLRSQGRTAWARFNKALSERRPPAVEVFDGAMIILGGALLLTPGFVTDILGLALLIPPSRAIVRRIGTRIAKGHVYFRLASWGSGAADARARRRAAGRPEPPPGSGPAPGPGGGRARSPYDYDGTAEEVRDPSGEIGAGGDGR